MSDGPTPKTKRAIVEVILWGSLIFTCGFVGTEDAIHGQYETSRRAFIALIVLAVAGFVTDKLLDKWLARKASKSPTVPARKTLAGRVHIQYLASTYKFIVLEASEGVQFVAEPFSRMASVGPIFDLKFIFEKENGPFDIESTVTDGSTGGALYTVMENGRNFVSYEATSGTSNVPHEATFAFYAKH